MNKFKCLGTLTLEQKKPIWKNKISGSQIWAIINTPLKIFNDKKDVEHIFDPNSNEIIRERMEAGNYQEKFILQEAIYRGKLPKDTKVDKNTYQSTIYDLRTANIDAYIGKDINNVEWIVEIKNTTEENIKALLERYVPQLLYYVWFFNAKKGGIFIFRINGWKLVKVELKLEDYQNYIEGIMTFIEQFEDCLINNLSPDLDDNYNEVKFFKLDNSEKSILIKQLIEKQTQEKQLKKELQTLKEQVLDFMELNTGYFDTNNNRKLVKVINERKGNIDYQAALVAMAEKYGESVEVWMEKYRKENIKNPIIKITNISNKDLENYELKGDK